MEFKNIVVILIVIIIILATAIGFMALKPMHAKEPTKIKLTSNKTLNEGESMSVKLTDLNKTPLSKQKVNITIKNSKGKVVANKTVKTDDKGNAKVDLNLKKGKYNVSINYSGNENYTGNNTTQELTIKEKVVKAAQEDSSNTESYSSTDNSGSSYGHAPRDGVDYDSSKMSYQEYASQIKNNPYGHYDMAGNYYAPGQGQGI